MLLKKYRLIYLFTPILICFISFFYFYKSKELLLYPSSLIGEHIPYSDFTEDQKGNSEILSFNSDSHQVSIEYIIKDKYEYPYAGFYLKLKDSINSIDISTYDYIEISFKNSNVKNLVIMLRTYIEKFSSLVDKHSLRYLVKEIELAQSNITVKIPLTSFNTALWWLEENNLRISEIGPPELSKLIDIKFESSELLTLNKSQSFTITNVSFIKNQNFKYVLIVLFLFFYYSVYITSYLFQKRKLSHPIITYDKIDLSNQFDEESVKLIEYIGKNYKNSSLTLSVINDDTGIPNNKITTIIKKGYNTTFKQYLNSIRLEEAKRLLLDTDRQINEIFWRVGYNNKTHFNRVFKEFYGISPLEFRKSKKNS